MKTTIMTLKDKAQLEASRAARRKAAPVSNLLELDAIFMRASCAHFVGLDNSLDMALINSSQTPAAAAHAHAATAALAARFAAATVVDQTDANTAVEYTR